MCLYNLTVMRCVCEAAVVFNMNVCVFVCCINVCMRTLCYFGEMSHSRVTHLILSPKSHTQTGETVNDRQPRQNIPTHSSTMQICFRSQFILRLGLFRSSFVFYHFLYLCLLCFFLSILLLDCHTDFTF